MGMSTHVTGFRAPDEKWQAMKKVWDICCETGVEVPDEVVKFFNYETPDELGIKVDLEKEGVARKWRNEHTSAGYEVDIAALPPNITHVRFENSW